MRRGSLCSGIEGLGLLLPGEPAWHAEVEPAPAALLAERFPGVPNLGDITAVDWSGVEPVGLLIAGPPCQPISCAGKQKGPDDERWLWEFVWGAVRVLRPRLVFLENPRRALGWWNLILGGLADIGGYEARWIVCRASGVGAPHKRERVFLLAADAAAPGWQPMGDALTGNGSRESGQPGAVSEFGGCGGAPADSQRGELWDEPRRGRWARGAGSSLTGDDGPGAPAADADEFGSWGGDASGRDARTWPEATPDAFYSDAGGLLTGRDEAHSAIVGRSSEGAPGQRAEAPDRLDWGTYEPAIRRWEGVLGRAAPAAVDERGRLSPAFVEWMMGLPAGWVGGMSRNQALKALGNAVVPQQARAAWDLLLRELHAEPSPRSPR